jgi:chromosome segregation ATPase
MKNKLSALLAVKAQANDAVDSALSLLYDLLQQEHDEQAAHDTRHAEELERGHAQIAELTGIKNTIRTQCDNGHEHLAFIDGEIADSNNHISWVDDRVSTLNTQREDLAAGRCESNAIFVQTLREHNDAFEIIAWLRKDLANWNAAANAGFAQISNVADKLKLYSHLFNEQALNEFIQLGEPKTWEELTDQTTRRVADEAHHDNARDALALEDAATSDRNTQGTVVDRILSLLDKLEAHLQESLHNLEQNEIKAAYDLADWLKHADAELVELAADRARKVKYLEKLALDREVAQEYVDRCEERYSEAVNVLQAAVDDLNAKIAWYEKETARRNEEIALLQECIAIFEERVSTMKTYLRDRIERYEDTQGFEEQSLRGVEF